MESAKLRHDHGCVWSAQIRVTDSSRAIWVGLGVETLRRVAESAGQPSASTLNMLPELSPWQ